MPHFCVSGIFSEVKTPFGEFFIKDGAFFRSEGLATLCVCALWYCRARLLFRRMGFNNCSRKYHEAVSFGRKN